MKRKFIFSLLLLIVVGGFGFSPLLQADEHLLLPEYPLEGMYLFTEKQCAQCHAIQGIGGKIGQDLGKLQLRHSFLELARSLWNHFPRMNESLQEENLLWAKFSQDEMRHLITFLYTIKYFDQPGDAALGERIFREKNCFRCHSVGGKGSNISVKLDDYQADISPVYISTELWNKRSIMTQKMKQEKIPQPQFQEHDVIDILAFIRAKGISKKTVRRYLPIANPAVGKELFDSKNCLDCHSIHGEGGTGGPDLASKELKMSLSNILSRFWNHGSAMSKNMSNKGVGFPKFTAEEFSNLAIYLYFIQFEDLPGSVTKGEQLFQLRHCKTCHFPNEENKRLGPNLANKNLETPLKILTEMWNHAAEIKEAMEEEEIRWPIFEKGEMRHLIAYIQSLAVNEAE
jgi:mono/diheme cytochrome c family protein